MATSSDIVRPLGHLEKFSASRHALGIYRGIALACRYSAPSQASEPRALETVLGQALARAVLRLPSLRVGIKDEDTNTPFFVRVPSLSLQDAIQWTSVSASDEEGFDAATLRVLEGQLEQLWPDLGTRPPWKLIVVRSKADASRLNIVLAVHHALADGKSAALFHSVLLEELNSPPGPPPELEGQLLRFPGAPLLTPPQEELVKFRISWGFLLWMLWRYFAPAWLHGPAPVAPWGGKPVSLEPHKLRLRLVELPAGLVPELLAGCRARGATLTTLLHVLTLASLARRLPADVAPAFTGNTAVSTQPFATVPEGLRLAEVMTDMNAGLDHVFDPQAVAGLRAALRGAAPAAAEDRVWGLAAKLRADLREQLGTITTDNAAGLLAWVGDWRRLWLEKVGKPRGTTWSMSNIGSMSAARAGAGGGEGAWRIRKAVFTQPAMVAGPAFGLNVAGVEGGPVTIVLNSQEGVVDEELMDGVARDLRAWTANFQRGGVFGVGSEAE